MADPIFSPPGIDMDMYKRWLASQQGGPAAGGGEPLYLPDDSVSDLGSWMTNISKGSNLGTDMDYLIQNNLLDYGAYDPITTYERGDAPGRRRLQQMENSGDPFQEFIAQGFLSGADANGVMRQLQLVISEPDNVDGQILAASIPRRYDDQGVITDVPDMGAVRSQLLNIESSVLGDPMGEMIDGQFMTSSTEDSPAMQALFKAGYTTRPGETYDPYSFAPAGVTRETDQAIFDDQTRANKALYGVDNPLAGTFGGDKLGGALPEMLRALRSLKPSPAPTPTPEPTAPPETPIEAAMRRNSVVLGPLMGREGSVADRMNFDLADVIPFGVRNFKGIVNNARNAFGSSPEEASAGAPSSYDSVASQLAELGQFSGPRGAMPMGADTTNDWQLFGEEPVRNNPPPAPTPIGPPSAPTPIEPPSAPRGGSPIDTDPYDPLRGEDYEREKQRIADVLAARGEGRSGGGGKVVQELARQAYLKADSLMGDGSTDQAARRAMERSRGGNYSPETIDSWTNLLRGDTQEASGLGAASRMGEDRVAPDGGRLSFGTFGLDGPTTTTRSGGYDAAVDRSSNLMQDAIRKAAQRANGERFAQADRAAGKAQQDYISAMTSANDSAGGIRQREALSRAMMAAGFSPFDDERRGRNQSVYGR